MTPCVELIPCLDMAKGRVVKGVQFEGLTDVGDPATLARRYAASGADRLSFLEVTGTPEGREALLALLREVSDLQIPLLAGGGVDSVESAEELVGAGASQVSVSSAAVKTPELIDALSQALGKDAVVVSCDVKTNPVDSGAPKYEVTRSGGKEPTGRDALEWVEEVERRGAGSIMLNSISTDGAQSGFDLDMLKAVRDRVGLKIIASGGVGDVDDFVAGAKEGADAVLAASVFHYGLVSVPDAIAALADAGFRPCP